MDTDFASISAKGTVVVYIKKTVIEAVIVQLASTHHFSLHRYPSFFLIEAQVLCSIFHHDLLIYKIDNTD